MMKFYEDIPGVASERIFGPPFDDYQPPDFADDLRTGIEWLKGFMKPGEWRRRRIAAARRLYGSALGQLTSPADGGRFFETSDTLGWYLFLGEAILEHPWNYEPLFGSRVLPILTAIGRDLTTIRRITGADARARRTVTAERAQPNGGLFELLVAAAYAREGRDVRFVPETKGGPRSHDIDVGIGGATWAVECKRMEASEYGERERARMRELWNPSADYLAHTGRSLIATVDFKIELAAVPDSYLSELVQDYIAADRTSWLWDDAIASGSMGELDLAPLRMVLEDDHVLVASTRMQELLTGVYRRDASMLTALRIKPAGPRYADDCDLAVVLRWQCLADASVEAKARDVLRHLADANDQLPNGNPSAVHIGWEALNGEAIERARNAKVLSTLERFDPGGKDLQFVYCHCFAPESPPDGLLSFDETVQWRGIRPTRARPLTLGTLVMPSDAETFEGTSWETR